MGRVELDGRPPVDRRPARRHAADRLLPARRGRSTRRVRRGQRNHPRVLPVEDRADVHLPAGAPAVRQPRSRLGDLRSEIDALAERYGERLTVVHHLDVDHGFVDADAIRSFLDAAGETEFYVCGPPPFMDIVETTLLAAGVAPASIHIERFTRSSRPARRRKKTLRPTALVSRSSSTGAPRWPSTAPERRSCRPLASSACRRRSRARPAAARRAWGVSSKVR